MIEKLLFLAVGCMPEYGTGPEVFSAAVVHDDDTWLFDQSRINRIDLYLEDESERILRTERALTDPRLEVRATAIIDEEYVGMVGVRLRGGLGSFRRYDKKPVVSCSWGGPEFLRWAGADLVA